VSPVFPGTLLLTPLSVIHGPSSLGAGTARG